MLVDIHDLSPEEGHSLKFQISKVKTLKELKTALSIIFIFSAEYEMDPELTPEDLEEIVEKTQELGKESFTVYIRPEDIEVDI